MSSVGWATQGCLLITAAQRGVHSSAAGDEHHAEYFREAIREPRPLYCDVVVVIVVVQVNASMDGCSAALTPVARRNFVERWPLVVLAVGGQRRSGAGDDGWAIPFWVPPCGSTKICAAGAATR